jgi:hypothetical protein
MKKCLAALFAAATLASCATYQPVPEGYAGPTANVRDTGGYIDGWSKGQAFSIVEVDGQVIKNTFAASTVASHMQGFNLNLDLQERRLPIRPMKVTLRGSHLTGAPIHAIAAKAAGTYFSVEGVVSFTPQADMQYLVRGELKRGESAVWIEERDSGKVVTEKVVEH